MSRNADRGRDESAARLERQAAESPHDAKRLLELLHWFPAAALTDDPPSATLAP